MFEDDFETPYGIASNRNWRAFEMRWKRHRRDNVRMGFGTWRAKPYCHERGTAHDMETTLFPDGSGGYRQCRVCGFVRYVGEY